MDRSDLKEERVDDLYNEIINIVKSYNPKVDEDLIYKAFLTAKKYHKNQFRKSGEPFIIHPLEVAKF